MLRQVLLGRCFAAVAIGLADHLPHFQSATGHQQRGQSSPVSGAAVALLLGRSSHFTGHQQQHLVGQATILEIVHECRNRMVGLGTQHVHSLDGGRVVAIVVEVPGAIDNRDESTAPFDQSPGHQHLVAQQVGDP